MNMHLQMQTVAIQAFLLLFHKISVMNQKLMNNRENINHLSVIDFAVFVDFEETTFNRFTFDS